MTGGETGRCRSPACPALISWALPEPGRPQVPFPVDHATAGQPGGNLEVWRDEAGQLRYRVLAGKDAPVAPGRRRGTPHWAVCPDAGYWRRKRRRS